MQEVLVRVQLVRRNPFSTSTQFAILFRIRIGLSNHYGIWGFSSGESGLDAELLKGKRILFLTRLPPARLVASKALIVLRSSFPRGKKGQAGPQNGPEYARLISIRERGRVRPGRRKLPLKQSRYKSIFWASWSILGVSILGVGIPLYMEPEKCFQSKKKISLLFPIDSIPEQGKFL